MPRMIKPTGLASKLRSRRVEADTGCQEGGGEDAQPDGKPFTTSGVC